MALHEPLEISYWLINTLSGSVDIFVFLSIFFIATMAAKFKMNNILFGMMIALYAVMMATIVTWPLLLVGLISGFIIFYTLGKMWNR